MVPATKIPTAGAGGLLRDWCLINSHVPPDRVGAGIRLRQVLP